MSAAVALGGFTGPEADTLGYAIRKKKSSVLRAQKEKFVTQAAERGVEPKVIDAVFKAFEPFERYGFNKAHATCYGLIAYQTAYLKANYTVEYMTSVLTAFRDNAEKVAAAVVECRRLGIEVRPPDVHRSGLGFTVEGDSIRFGLLAVKNVGEGAIESIIEARESGGEFRSLTDFCSRVDLRLTNRKVLESLAKVGALNVFGHPAQLLLGLDDALAVRAGRRSATGSPARRRCSTWRATTRSILERPLPVTPETPVRERLRWEKELLGLYLSDHPMGEVAERVGQFVTAYSGDLKDESLDGQRVVIGGIVTGSRTIITKSKSTMAVVTLEDLQGTRRGRRVPADLRADARPVARGRDPARRGSGRPPGRGGVAARGRGLGLGRGGGARRRGVRARGRGARPAGRRASRRAGRRQRLGLRERQRVRRRRPSGGGGGGTGHGSGRAVGRRRRVAGPRLADARRTDDGPARRSPRPSRSRPTRSRRTSPRRRWPAGRRRPRSRRSPTSSATSPRRPPRPPASRSTPRPAPCSTCGSRGTPAPTASCRRCRRSRPCSASARAARGSSSTCRRPAGRRCRWSSGASPTTPSCWPRCAAASARGHRHQPRLTSPALPPRNRTTAAGTIGSRRWWSVGPRSATRRRRARACSSRRREPRRRGRCP